MGSGAVALAAPVLTLSLPKAAHAIAATAVQVMNTSSTPAITEGVSKLASQSVGLLCYAGYPCYSRSAPCCSTYQVPAGHNLVITDLEALTSTGSGCTVGISPYPGGYPDQWSFPSDGFTHQVLFPTGITFLAGYEFTAGNVSQVTPTCFEVFLRGYLPAN